jgi:hypothetical protein
VVEYHARCESRTRDPPLNIDHDIDAQAGGNSDMIQISLIRLISISRIKSSLHNVANSLIVESNHV